MEGQQQCEVQQEKRSKVEANLLEARVFTPTLTTRAGSLKVEAEVERLRAEG